MNDVNVDEIIGQLIRLQFFRFTVTENLNRAIENVRRNFLRSRHLDSTDEQWHRSDERGYTLSGMERRIYHGDAEDLAEGDVCEVLREMMPMLTQEGVYITSCEDEGILEREVGAYNVIINGQRYPILSTQDEGSDWARAHRRTIEITNGLLETAGSKERLFGQASGNDVALILLTEELFHYLRTLPLDALDIPFRAEDINLDAGV